MKAFLGIILALLAAAGVYAWSSDRPASASPQTELFTVVEGDGPRDIAARLKDAHLLRSEKWFLFVVWRRGTSAEFKAGSFELSSSMRPGEIERALIGNKPLTNEREITVIEGWTLEDIAAYLEKESVAPKTAFAAEAGASAEFSRIGVLPDWEASFPVLLDRPDNASLEGYLFPDTYRIYLDADAKTIVRRMLVNFEAKLTPELRAEIKKSGRTVFEIITMASVIEREVRSDEERALVSDLFWRRVDSGRGLEADSTVNYCTGKSLAAVSHEDTKVECLWNTYKYRGLPAGPIGNPGMSSILAAIRPKANDYWYFLTDEAGTVYYGKTLDEHNENKRRYLK